MRQLVFELPANTSYRAEDFLVSDCNEAAFRSIQAWPRWASRHMILVGPEGSGKSHLAAIWAESAGAGVLTADALPKSDLAASATAPAVLVEDVGEKGVAEAELFHLINLVREHDGYLLFTASVHPGLWSLATADLRSRLRLATVVEISPPDDALVASVLVKLFADRQLAVDAGVVSYLALRMERSLSAARSVVEALDREALVRGRRITRAMAAEVLRRHSPGDD